MKRVAVENRDDCVVVRFVRPEARNALDRVMVAELRAVLADLWHSRPAACVLVGTGKAFCAGGDLKERRALTKTAVRELRREIVDLFTAMAESPVPLIAAVNGSAFGGGFELALACDFVVALQDAVFALPEVGLGIIPAGGGTQNLVRVGGLALARRVILLGERLSATQAHNAGLVLSVHRDTDELMTASFDLTETLSAKSKLAVLQARRAMRDAWGYDMATALRRENELYDPCIDDPERDAALDRFAGGVR